MDLLGIQDKQKQATKQNIDESKFVGDHTIKRRGSVSRQQLGKGAWTPDKFVQNVQEAQAQGKSTVDGIIKPGEVDDEHREFLKKTTMID